jgi:glucan phosphoethanolaminetransferase (alkaline phosphatase superfamily)
MSPENPGDALPGYVRFLLLVFGEVIAGAVLYTLFPFMPAAAQVLVFLGATVIAMSGRPKPKDEKSLASLLSAYTGVFLRICAICVIVLERIRPRITREDVKWRVVFVCVCLVAALRLLDGRVGYRE